MPGSNPVSSHPGPNTTQPKSLRSRFGFGSGNSSIASKSSFFAQLNLKPTKKPLGGSQDRGQEQTVVIIDSPVEKEESLSGYSHKGSKSQDFDSLSKATASRIKHVFTHSSPISSSLLERHKSLDHIRNSFSGLDNSLTSEDLVADNSGISKQLPDLPADLSLIKNEQPLPDTASSHSGFGNQSQESPENLSSSLPTNLSNEVTVNRGTAAIKEVMDAWLNPMEDSKVLSSPDASDVHLSVESSRLSTGSGPVVTSTPFHARRVSHTQPEKDNDISLDLSALDPDLVALLRPNNLQDQEIPRVASPIDQSEIASPSVSPNISPTRTSFRLPIGQGSTPNRSPGVPGPISPPSPFRPTFRSQSNIPSHAPQPTPLRDHIPWLELHKNDSRQPSPDPSTVASSDLATPSDISKYAGPLSGPILSKNDARRKRDSQFLPNAILTEVPRNIPSRFAQTSATDSRPSSRLTQRPNDYRPASASSEVLRPYAEIYSSIGRERDRMRAPIEEAFSSLRPASQGSPFDSSLANSVGRPRGNSIPSLSQGVDNRGRDPLAKRRLRKRSMSLDQGPSTFQEELRVNAMLTSRYHKATGDDAHSEAGHSNHRYSSLESNGPTYSFRDADRDRYNHVREQPIRISREWLGPRTARAFAAAGLLDDSREREGSRYSAFSRSMSEREYPATLYGMRDQNRSGFSLSERDRDREFYSRHGDRDYRSPVMRSGAISPSISSTSRPLSRADSSSYSRPPTLFSRTMSDLVSQHNDRRDSLGSTHPRTSSSYSGLPSGSTGSGGGRTSPTIASPLIAAQSQIQSLKDKHDAQTEALLAALADSQNTCKELRSQNEALKMQIQQLEERLAESIAKIKQKDKALSQAMNKRQNSSEHATGRQPSSNRLEYRAPRQPSPSRHAGSRPISSGSRRVSSSSSIFPTIPRTMSLLMSERPDTPGSQASSNQSPPPSPTLVLPKPAGKETSSEPPIPETSVRTHKRSTSGISVATSANFSFETSSPGSLKLKPEHEMLLGDVTHLSLTSELGEAPEH